MKNFTDSERKCETNFQCSCPYWHAYTSGRDTALLFTNDNELVFVMNLIAQTASLYQGVTIIAFELMNNHFHFIVSARREAVIDFWQYLQKRLKRFFAAISQTQLSIKQIDTLQSLRNNIVYTNRNGYVANPNYTPFSYPWGTGRYYFLDSPSGINVSDARYDDLRTMFRCRTLEMPDNWQIKDGYIMPSSYCAVKFGMSLFRDAHHYFAMVSKNVEAYSEVAVEIDDGEFLTDSELFEQLMRIIKKHYGQTSMRSLTGAQKMDLARCLHYDFRSSNGQIRRLLGLAQYEIDSLFPLSASTK